MKIYFNKECKWYLNYGTDAYQKICARIRNGEDIKMSDIENDWIVSPDAKQAIENQISRMSQNHAR